MYNSIYIINNKKYSYIEYCNYYNIKNIIERNKNYNNKLKEYNSIINNINKIRKENYIIKYFFNNNYYLYKCYKYKYKIKI